MKILGLNYGGHDTSAALTIDGDLIAACEQERYDYVKHSRNFPIEAIFDCLKKANLKINDIDIVSLGHNPILENKYRYFDLAFSIKERSKFIETDIERIKRNFYYEEFLRSKLKFKNKIEFNNHHLCHLYSAFIPSSFKKSLVISYDGLGEIHTAQFGIGNKKKIKVIHDQNKFPHSLGLIYSAITDFLGWKHHCDEGIIMGLAPYGNYNSKLKRFNETYINYFRKFVTIDKKDPLKYIIDFSYFGYNLNRDSWVTKKFNRIFGHKRTPNSILKSHHKNIAAALQKRIEEIVIFQIRYLKQLYKIDYLCIAGGLGLNCSLNGKIEKEKIFKKIFIQPASGDSGLAYGSCIVSNINNNVKLKTRRIDFYKGYSDRNISILKNIKLSKLYYKKINNYSLVADFLLKGKIISWFQDSAEFGPRALGNRSILSRPYPLSIKDHINKNVKFREYFRPFAPAIMKEYLYDYFEINQESDHMLIACKVKKNKKKFIPATVHIDNSCRVQSVSKKTNKKFWLLLNEFYKLSKVPVLLNTSFNIKGQPIVNNSLDAIKCFKKYKIDYLVIDNFILSKKNDL